ncbi:MAG TPA: hypothetical protein VKE51_19235 [Vicinamibacterales bacterium]|nr:hypothetical protein [Vicinamibacterales bacterium]
MTQRTLVAAIGAVITVGLALGIERSVAAASYPASYWTTRTMTVPVPSCLNAASKAVTATGLSGVTSSETATGGHTATTRGYIICVRLPKAGACNGDGATAVLVTAGSDAKVLLDKLDKNLKTPTLIDCGHDEAQR